MKSDSTIFYKEFLDVIECYNLETDQLQMFKLIVRYGLGDEKAASNIPQKLKPAFISIKAIIDKSTAKYKTMITNKSEAGRKGMQSRWGAKHKKYTDEEETKFSTVVAYWNELQLTQVKKLTDERKELLTILFENYTTDDFKTVCGKINESEFLKGKNKDLWFVNFDWLINVENFTKVFEDKYKTRENSNSNNDINKIWENGE